MFCEPSMNIHDMNKVDVAKNIVSHLQNECEIMAMQSWDGKLTMT